MNHIYTLELVREYIRRHVWIQILIGISSVTFYIAPGNDKIWLETWGPSQYKDVVLTVYGFPC